MTSDIWELIASFLFGSFIGGYVTHRFAIRLEARARRIELLGFLHQWRHEIERFAPKDSEGIWKNYRAREGDFRKHVGKMDGDFMLHRRSFKRITDLLIRLHSEDISRGKDFRLNLVTPIDRLIKHLSGVWNRRKC